MSGGHHGTRAVALLKFAGLAAMGLGPSCGRLIVHRPAIASQCQAAEMEASRDAALVSACSFELPASLDWPPWTAAAVATCVSPAVAGLLQVRSRGIAAAGRWSLNRGGMVTGAGGGRVGGGAELAGRAHSTARRRRRRLPPLPNAHAQARQRLAGQLQPPAAVGPEVFVIEEIVIQRFGKYKNL